MFDFGANIRDEGGVQGRNNKGLITYDRKIKKDAFYLYKAHWSDEKFVHITGKRFVDRTDDTIDIKVYSNCNEVNLSVNGGETTTLTSEDKIFVFENISLKEGINEVKVFAKDGNTSLQDVATFNNVDNPNESYFIPEEEGGFVANWFDMPELGDVEMEELVITDDVYSTRCTVGELFKNEETKAIVTTYLGNVEEHPMFDMMQGFTIDAMSQIASDQFSEKMLYTLNKKLSQIKKSEQ